MGGQHIQDSSQYTSVVYYPNPALASAPAPVAYQQQRQSASGTYDSSQYPSAVYYPTPTSTLTPTAHQHQNQAAGGTYDSSQYADTSVYYSTLAPAPTAHQQQYQAAGGTYDSSQYTGTPASNPPLASSVPSYGSAPQLQPKRIPALRYPDEGYAAYMCDQCRKRNWGGCDKKEPNCGRCTRLNMNCTYEFSVATQEKSRKVLQAKQEAEAVKIREREAASQELHGAVYGQEPVLKDLRDQSMLRDQARAEGRVRVHRGEDLEKEAHLQTSQESIDIGGVRRV
jgi:hypothetical protein